MSGVATWQRSKRHSREPRFTASASSSVPAPATGPKGSSIASIGSGRSTPCPRCWTPRARLGRRATHVQFEVVDLWRWAPERLWDCALACFFIEHVPDEVLSDLLRALHDALRPGGTIFVAEGAAYATEPQVEIREIQGRQFQVVERRRTPAELTEMFGAAGFTAEIKNSARYIHLTGHRD